MAKVFPTPGAAPLYASKDHKGTSSASGVNAIAVSPRGKWFATASVDTTVRLYDAVNNKTAQILYGHESKVQGVAFASDSANFGRPARAN